MPQEEQISSNPIASLFSVSLDAGGAPRESGGSREPRIIYLIAMTPRSGSSFICDIMAMTKVFGWPGEYFNADWLPEYLANFPAASPAIFLRNVLRQFQSPNGVAGVKASWFQFAAMAEAAGDQSVFSQMQFIYLRRKNTAAQAVSLFRAVESAYWHTNVPQSGDSKTVLEGLPYSFEKIDHWHKHILDQEAGWEQYFKAHGIAPLRLHYEDLEDGVERLVRKVAAFLNIADAFELPEAGRSAFRKMDDAIGIGWADDYEGEGNARP